MKTHSHPAVWRQGLLVLAAMAWAGWAAAATPGPTPEERREADRVARQHLGDAVVDGFSALDGRRDPDLVARSTRGERINAAFAELTGLAVNPLVGITALGMYHYFTAPDGSKAQLPYYDQPYVWGVLLAVILLMAFNSTLCEAMPFLKVPLNVLGDLVNKGGAVVVLPVALHVFANAFAEPAGEALLAAANWAAPTAMAAESAAGPGAGWWTAAGWLAAATLGLVVYASVWLVWNVVDVLIMIAPFPGLDAALKSIRLAAMGGVTLAASLGPWIGLAVSAAMAVVCVLLAGWAFRWSAMGWVFAWDFILFRNAWRDAPSDTDGWPPAFAAFSTAAVAAVFGQVPARTYGTLRRDADGTLRFTWRPWFVGPRRELDLGAAADFLGGSALFYPAVLNKVETVLFRLPPRYRSSPSEVQRVLGLGGWRGISFVHLLRRGWRGVEQPTEPAATE